jgi:TonB-linked SusC/RagA family outer membrane protein
MNKQVKWKLLALVSCFFFCCVFDSVAQEKGITIHVRNASLKEVFHAIEQQTTYRFSYRSIMVDSLKNITVAKTNVTVSDILDEVLQGRNFIYKIVSPQSIVLSDRQDMENKVKGMDRKYSGTVTDEKGETVIGASISIKGSKTGTVTDMDGRFSIVAPAGSTLSVSYIGFTSEDVKLENKLELQIVISEDVKSLSEVVVVGYGVQRKRDVTTAISSLKSSELATPVTSLDQAMTGKLAGVQVLQPNGIPGGGMSIKVRGIGTISAGADPLYVIDGFPMSDGAANATGMKVNPLSSININDIESIEVLKDASSAAIYGSRGANGVVIITTKKGKESKPAVQYDGYYGWQKTTRKIEMMNAYQQAEILYESRNTTYLEALTAAGITGSITDTNDERRQKLGQPLTSKKLNYLIPEHIYPYLNGEQGLTDTDWQEEVMRTAPIQSHNISITGGTQAARYFVSTTYVNDKGIVLGSGFDQMGGRAKIDSKYNKLAFGANVSFNHSNYDLVPTEDRYANETILSTALGMLPSFPVYNADGSYNYDQYTLDCGIPNLINPVALALERKDNMKRNRMLGNLYAEYEFAKDLKLKTSYGTDYNSFRRNIFRPSTLPTAINQTPPSIPTGESRTKDVINWVWENTLSYYTMFNNDHTLSVLAGWTAQKESVDNSRITGTGYPNDLIPTLNASSVATNWDATRQQWSLLSALARAQYSYKGKYLLSAAIRSDGSSRFGQNNRWGQFPSVSGGWYITEEDFMANQHYWLSSLKLRASYGISGNFSIGNYEYYARIGDDNYVLGIPEAVGVGLVPISAGNPELGWEKTEMTNIGLEIGLFQRINLEVDVYNSITSDMLLSVPVPEFSGFSTVLKNIGKLQNRGLEISLNIHNQWGDFTWNNRLNYSMNRNVVLDLGGVEEMITKGETMDFITKIGEPIGNYYAYITDGVFMNQEEIDIANDLNDDRIAKVTNAKPGDFKFVDVEKDGIIDSNDKTIVGNYMPDFTYGFSTELQYRRFDLSVALQGVYGNEIANINRRYLNNMEGGSGQIDALNRWKSEENPGNGLVNRANRSATGMNSQMSTWHIENGSYLRVRNITLGVTLPQEWMKHLNITRARVYFSSQNPFTMTKYTGYNPEVDMKGDPLTPGIDYGTYPLAKSAVIGLNLIF